MPRIAFSSHAKTNRKETVVKQHAKPSRVRPAGPASLDAVPVNHPPPRPHSSGLRFLSSSLALAILLVALWSVDVRGRSAFTDEYDNCPAALRLDSVEGMAVEYTDEEDEIVVAWRPLTQAVLDAFTEEQRYQAQITVLLQSRQTQLERSAPLGAREIRFDGLATSTEWEASLALTHEDHVISDIATLDFVSSMATPAFCSAFFAVPAALPAGGVLTAQGAAAAGLVPTAGRFYYIGYGSAFRLIDADAESHFRIGLSHGTGSDPDASDFEHYRLTVSRADDGDILDFRPATVPAPIYETQVLALLDHADNAAQNRAGAFATIRETARATGGMAHPQVHRWELVAATDSALQDVKFAPGPIAHYDVPRAVFDADGIYTLTAWAEDEAGTKIGPQAKITFLVQHDPARTHVSLLDGFTPCDTRGQAAVSETPATVLGPLPIAAPPAPPRVALLSVCEGAGTTALTAEQKTNAGLVTDCNALLTALAHMNTFTEVPTSQPYSSGACHYGGVSQRTGHPWDWSVNRPIASWGGITLGGNPLRVQRVDLGCRKISGTLSTAFAWMDDLRRLEMDRGPMDGTIPQDLEYLTHLEFLDLSDTAMTGSIPIWLGRMTSLRQLILKGSLFNGSLPAELGRLSNLTHLDVSNILRRGTVENRLSGSIPPELGNLSNLQWLALDDNELSGSIPPELGNLSNLDSLILNNNNLSGSIPSSLTQLTSLRGRLFLGGRNNLTGCIPIGLPRPTYNDIGSLGLPVCTN